MTSTQARARGTLLGLACGDALGRPVEFMSPNRINRKHGRVTEMLANGTHGQPAGTITDDTEMALCIARSLTEHGRFVPEDVADRFVSWKDSGPFDIGIMTANALRRIDRGEPWDEAGRQEWEARPEGSNAGNGSLMRCAPYAIAYRNRPDRLVEISRQSSSITHADPRCQWSCALFNRTLANLLTEVDQPLGTAFAELESELPDEVREAAESVLGYLQGRRDELDLENSGYVITSLQAGFFHGLTADVAKEGIIDAVMMGGDTDTIAAVTGAVVGARFGEDALPNPWLESLSVRSELECLADRLLQIDP